jgi:hypothetical protein
VRIALAPDQADSPAGNPSRGGWELCELSQSNGRPWLARSHSGARDERRQCITFANVGPFLSAANLERLLSGGRTLHLLDRRRVRVAAGAIGLISFAWKTRSVRHMRGGRRRRPARELQPELRNQANLTAHIGFVSQFGPRPSNLHQRTLFYQLSRSAISLSKLASRKKGHGNAATVSP